MCHSENYLKGLVRLAERTQGFLEDGYSIMFQHKDQSLCLVKLRHPNGNIITLSFDSDNGIISQRTNGRETHLETMR